MTDSTLQRMRDDEHDARSELAEAEAAYVEAAQAFAQIDVRFQDVWAEKNSAEQVRKEAAARYRAAFQSAHGCNLPDLTGEIMTSRIAAAVSRQ